MKIFTFEVHFINEEDEYACPSYGIVTLAGAEVFRHEVSSYRLNYSGAPGEHDELKDEVLYEFGLKLGELLKKE